MSQVALNSHATESVKQYIQLDTEIKMMSLDLAKKQANQTRQRNTLEKSILSANGDKVANTTTVLIDGEFIAIVEFGNDGITNIAVYQNAIANPN